MKATLWMKALQEGQKIEMINSINRVNLHFFFFFFSFVLSRTEEITVQQAALLLVAGKRHL